MKTIFQTLAAALYRRAGYVPFLWHIDDVRCVIEDQEIPLSLTDAECLQILIDIRDYIPADVGMSFDAIEAELDALVERRAESGAAD